MGILWTSEREQHALDARAAMAAIISLAKPSDEPVDNGEAARLVAKFAHKVADEMAIARVRKYAESNDCDCRM